MQTSAWDARFVRKGAGPFYLRFKVRGGFGKSERLQLDRVACAILTEQDEISHVGDKNEVILVPILADLRAFGSQPRIVRLGLDLHDAAFGGLALNRIALAGLLGGVEAKIGVIRPLLPPFSYARDLGPEGIADAVQQIVQRRVIGTYRRRAAGRADAEQVREVVLNGGAEFCGVGRHSFIAIVPQCGHGESVFNLSWLNPACLQRCSTAP